MAEPWFDPGWFGTLFGALAGGIGGSLLGVWGGLLGTFAWQGKHRALVLGGLYVFALVGLAFVGFGVLALAAGQPWGIWYGPLLLGLLFTVLVPMALGLGHRAYATAEKRRLQAEALRNR